MASAIDTLDQFITRAERDRKYAPNTAAGLRAALKMFAAAMNEQERESLEVLETRLDQIYNEVFRRKSGKMSSQSLQTYYNRVKRIIHDYNTYGTDPLKMSSWSPQRRFRASGLKTGKKTKPKKVSTTVTDVTSDHDPLPFLISGANDRFEISFDSGQRAVIILPSKRGKADILKLQKLVEFLEATSAINDEGKGPDHDNEKAQ